MIARQKFKEVFGKARKAGLNAKNDEYNTDTQIAIKGRDICSKFDVELGFKYGHTAADNTARAVVDAVGYALVMSNYAAQNSAQRFKSLINLPSFD